MIILVTVVVVIIENQEHLELGALEVTRECLEVIVNTVQYTNPGTEEKHMQDCPYVNRLGC